VVGAKVPLRVVGAVCAKNGTASGVPPCVVGAKVPPRVVGAVDGVPQCAVGWEDGVGCGGKP
jgi:hypothetical protein